MIDAIIDYPVSGVDLSLLQGIWGLDWGVLTSARVLNRVGFTRSSTIWHKWRGITGILPFGVTRIEKIVVAGTGLHLSLLNVR